MALLGTFIDTRTVAAAATASGTFTHAIGQTPDFQVATPLYATGTLTTEFPYWASQYSDTKSVTFFNRGKTAETYQVATVYCHSIIR